MSGRKKHEDIFGAVKDEARRQNKEMDILTDVGLIPRENLTDKEGPCPWCLEGGSTRFRVMDRERGAVRCSHCFSEDCGDFIAAVAKGRGVEPKEACRLCAEYLGMDLPLSGKLRTEITRHCNVVKMVEVDGETEYQPTHPPQWLVKGVMHDHNWQDIPRLQSITQTPLIRPDGTVLQTPGYDPESEVYYAPSHEFPPVPESPSKGDALRSLDRLSDVVGDFPFKAEMHKGAWLAGALTPPCKLAFEGNSPMFTYDASVQGTGKGLLATVTAYVAIGRNFSVTPFSNNTEELRKIITTLALSGEPTILFDNVTGAIDKAPLNAALTTTSWRDRILATNDAPTIPLNIVWYMTGNHLEILGDIGRRICHIQLESDLEDPQSRNDFRHPDLEAYVKNNLPTLVVDVLTIARAWFAAGRPRQKLPAWGSFNGWELVRQIVTWLGYPDPVKTRAELDSADESKSPVRQMIRGLLEIDPDRQGVTAKDILDAIKQPPVATYEHDSCPELRTAVMDLGRKNELPTARSLGMRLKKMCGRVVDHQKIGFQPDPTTKTSIYSVLDISPGTTGTSGTYFYTQDFSGEIEEENREEKVVETKQVPEVPGDDGVLV